MPLNLTKPAEGDVGWAADVNQNFTDIETRVNALGTRLISTTAPITGGGDLSADRTIALAAQAANTVLAGPTGGADATPTARALVAADIPALDAAKITSGTLDAARLPTIGASKGGTAQTTYATGDLLYASAVDTLAKLSAGTNGHVLTLASGLPSWAAATGGSGAVDPATCHGRLTASSTLAVTTADTTSATLYFLPRSNAGLTNTGSGGKVAVFNGSAWVLRDIGASGVSASVTSLTTTTTPVYDVFIYDNAGTLTLDFVKWTSDTARATALAVQDGVPCKSGALTYRYLGTIYVVDNGGTISVRDSAAQRFIWNNDSRVPRFMNVHDSTDSWSYTTATWRQANGSTANKVEFVVGVAGDRARAFVQGLALNAGAVHLGVGIGLDSTSTNSALAGATYESGNQHKSTSAEYAGCPSAGYHYLAWLEYSQASGSTQWWGDAGFAGGTIKSGLVAEVQA